MVIWVTTIDSYIVWIKWHAMKMKIMFNPSNATLYSNIANFLEKKLSSIKVELTLYIWPKVFHSMWRQVLSKSIVKHCLISINEGQPLSPLAIHYLIELKTANSFGMIPHCYVSTDIWLNLLLGRCYKVNEAELEMGFKLILLWGFLIANCTIGIDGLETCYKLTWCKIVMRLEKRIIQTKNGLDKNILSCNLRIIESYLNLIWNPLRLEDTDMYLKDSSHHLSWSNLAIPGRKWLTEVILSKPVDGQLHHTLPWHFWVRSDEKLRLHQMCSFQHLCLSR